MQVQLAFEQAAQDYIANSAKIEEGAVSSPSVAATILIRGIGTFPLMVSYHTGPLVLGQPLGPTSFYGEFASPPQHWYPPRYAGSVTVTNFGGVALQVLPTVLVQVTLGTLVNLRGGRSATTFVPYWSTDQRLEGTLDAPAGSEPQIEVVFGRYFAPAPLFQLTSDKVTTPGNVTGIVTDDGQRALPGAHVGVAGLHPVRTDVDGRYTLTGLHPGAVHLVVSDGIRFLPQSATVLVVPNVTAEFDFALVSAGKP